MKRLIKKILNYFGYYNQSDISNMGYYTQNDLDKNEMDYNKKRYECILKNKQTYIDTFVKDNDDCIEFRIFVFYPNIEQLILIKTFTTDDYDYGIIYVNELIEKLNEKDL